MTLDLISDEWNTARQDAGKDTRGNFGVRQIQVSTSGSTKQPPHSEGDIIHEGDEHMFSHGFQLLLFFGRLVVEVLFCGQLIPL